jgi:hypothetical protein
MLKALLIVALLSIFSPLSFGAKEVKKVVSVREVGIRLEVPSTWQYQAEGDTYYFRDNTSKEQLTLSAFGLKTKLSVEQRQDTMLRLLNHRRRAEREEGGVDVKMSEPQFGEKGETLLVRYQGSAAQGKRNFAFIMFGLPDRIVNVYYESLSISGSAFEQRVRELLNSIQLGASK